MKVRVRLDRGGSPVKLAAPRDIRVYQGVAARTHAPGDSLRYQHGDAVVDEYRDAGELARVVEQLPGKKFLLQHPDGPNKLLMNGAVGHVIGRVRAARVDDDSAVVDVEVDDAAGEAAIDAGMHELSLGYKCRADAGGYQRDTVVDHLALVPKARCGDRCSMRADCQGDADVQACPCKFQAMSYDVQVDMPGLEHKDAQLNAKERHALPSGMFADPKHEGLPLEDETHVKGAMARFDQEHFTGPADRKAAFHRIVARAHQLGIDPSGFVKKYGGRLDDEEIAMDELQKKLDAALADAAAQKARADKAEQSLQASGKRADALELERDEAKRDLKVEKTRADKAEDDAKAAGDKARTDAAGEFNARVDARVALLATANQVLGAEKDGKPVDRTKMSDHEIMCAVVEHVDGDDLKDEKRVDFVRGSYEGAVKRHAKAAGSRGAVRETLEKTREDGVPKAAALAETEAAKRGDQARKNAWKTPAQG